MDNDKTFLEVLEERKALGQLMYEAGHFRECYLVAYPDDPEAYCTCMSWCPD